MQIKHNLPAKEYHAIDACSSSWLKVARRGAIEFVHKKLNPIEEKSDSLLVGDIVHSLVFPSTTPVTSEYMVIPDGIDRRTKEGKAAYAELEQDPRQKISKKLYDKAHEIANHVLSVDLVRNIKDHSDSYNEVSGFFTNSGIDCKCRWDLINPHVGLILDLKTTANGTDQQSFAKTIAQYIYDQQAAWYVDAAERAYGKIFKFAFVVVSTNAPYDVALYEADDQMLETGRQLYKENIELYKKFSKIEETDVSKLLKKKQFSKISLPSWATDLGRR